MTPINMQNSRHFSLLFCMRAHVCVCACLCVRARVRVCKTLSCTCSVQCKVTSGRTFLIRVNYVIELVSMFICMQMGRLLVKSTEPGIWQHREQKFSRNIDPYCSVFFFLCGSGWPNGVCGNYSAHIFPLFIFTLGSQKDKYKRWNGPVESAGNSFGRSFGTASKAALAVNRDIGECKHCKRNTVKTRNPRFKEQ